MPHGPRIYNLFPLLAGGMEGWPEHLPRIRGMGFDWIFVNPFHYPGFSGSLYAIKDPARLHPVVQGESEADADTLVEGFVRKARSAGLSVMLDLVINHTSKDALLVGSHPDWYKRDPEGELWSPRAVDPVDPRLETVWGDLAELDYHRLELREGQLAYWSDYVRHYLSLGVKGFRCDAAYQVPADVWKAIIAEAREAEPGCVFAAETLGCTPEQVTALADAGFDYYFNSAKWWDFRESWLLDQYELYRPHAPTIAFPESHDTPRLVRELLEAGVPDEMIEAHYRLRYLFAATFSTGVMMPMGFEFGFAKHLDVVGSRPGDWQWESGQPRFDLCGFIAAVNEMKKGCLALNVEGSQRRVTGPESPVTGLLRAAGPDMRIAGEASVVIINPDQDATHGIEPGTLLGEAGGWIDRFEDITPEAAPIPFEPGHDLTLAPLELRVFRGSATPRPRSELKGPTARTSQQRLDHLAANRIAIEKVYPELDGGRHPVKRCAGDVLDVRADILGDGHEILGALVRYRREGERRWREAAMQHVDNDRWQGSFALTRIGRWVFTIEAWRDLFATWRMEIGKKIDADKDVSLELIEGRQMIEKAAKGGDQTADARYLTGTIAELDTAEGDQGRQIAILLSPELLEVMRRAADRTNLSRYERDLEVIVDRRAARFAAWYEMFPRSQSGDPTRHGTFDDVIERLPYVRDMGFDVLYFTPIHPIGRVNRKGRNNSLVAGRDDPGSPYAIGSSEGGHKALHPELGTMEDFHRLVAAAYDHGLEIALDFAIQCAPDHPWLEEHPEWFDWRPDGSIKFAENPPKKYEDIVNVHFYRGALPSIWYELRDVVLFWIDQGVKIFRVDNPHTKPLPFWEWMIRDVKERHPDAIFLAEAFTRPKMMKRLAKIGFTQSYTYFTWRNTKHELIEYLTELTRDEPREYYRPNFFANTPDINPRFLQSGKPAAFVIRGTLAATLSSVYGLYNGFELCEGAAVPGKEEYLDSEKYEIKAWDWDRPGNIREFITDLNRIRRDNPALHETNNLTFYNAWNDNILLYGKMTAARDNFVLVAVNLDPDRAQGAHFEVPLWEFGLPDDAVIEVEDMLSGHRFAWHGKVQQVWLEPQTNPCALWRLIPPGATGR